MPNELQAAFTEGAAELSSTAGESFAFGVLQFTAWPVLGFVQTPGRMESAPEQAKTYEAVRSTAPTFSRGAALTLEGAAVRVGKVYPTDPTTGRFQFSLS
jgi:hypothetical protein